MRGLNSWDRNSFVIKIKDTLHGPFEKRYAWPQSSHFNRMKDVIIIEIEGKDDEIFEVIYPFCPEIGLEVNSSDHVKWVHACNSGTRHIKTSPLAG